MRANPRLTDRGGTMLLARIDRVWFAVVAGHYGWGVTPAAAINSALRVS